MDESPLERARRTMGSVGVHLPVGNIGREPVADVVQAAQRLEEAGYDAVWSSEGVGGKDGLVEIAVILGATERIVVGSGISTMWARPAVTAHAAASVLAAAYPGRFVLGLGVGYPQQAAAMGLDYGRPLTLMREYLTRMNVAIDEEDVDTAVRYPRILAALGPGMVELAGELAEGAHPTAVPVEHTARTREALGPDKLLVVGLGIVPDDDAERARNKARAAVSGLIGSPGSPYAANLVRLGYAERDIHTAADSVVDALFARGRGASIAARVREHLDAGADQVQLTPLTQDFDAAVAELLSIAPAMTTDVN